MGGDGGSDGTSPSDAVEQVSSDEPAAVPDAVSATDQLNWLSALVTDRAARLSA